MRTKSTISGVWTEFSDKKSIGIRIARGIYDTDGGYRHCGFSRYAVPKDSKRRVRRLIKFYFKLEELLLKRLTGIDL